MAKRKEVAEDNVEDNSPEESPSEGESSSDDDDINMIDVEFEWFDPQPDIDFQGIKLLLRQLFDADSQMLNLSALTDLILAQPLLGSTVKVDGNQTDPYAFLTVLNIKEHMGTPAIRDLMSYLNDRAKEATDPALLNGLTSKAATIGLILTERLINVPSEVSPPMYKMLLEEVQWAVEENEPYTFSHFLMISKTYQEIDSNVDLEEDVSRKHKKQKISTKNGGSQTFYFHPEDEILHKYSVAYGDFAYVKSGANNQSDSKTAFRDLGIKPKGHMILLEAAKLEGAIKDMETYFGQN